jgi:K+-sensing histidine kinase KdpD
VSKAIVDFVVQHNIDKIVLGSSSRNAFTRYFFYDTTTSVHHLYYLKIFAVLFLAQICHALMSSIFSLTVAGQFGKWMWLHLLQSMHQTSVQCM